MSTTAYLIRCQGVGILTDRVFLRHPTEAELRDALSYELERHGLTIDGKARERWVMSQRAEVVGACAAHVGCSQASCDYCYADEAAAQVRKLIGKLDDEAVARILAAKAGDQPANEVVGAAPLTQLHGEGSVVNPGEPGWVDGTEAKKARMADQDRRAREAQTITSDDVATIKASDILKD